MGWWLLAYIAMGQLLVPGLLALLDIEQAQLSTRAAALLNLGLDVGQVGLTLSILASCLGKYRPRARGLFPCAWRGGSWLKLVAAGAACFPLVDWLAHSSASLLTGGEPPTGADVWSGQIEAGVYDADWLTCGVYVAVVSLCAPLWEEAIFRGFLLPSLGKHTPRSGAVLGSALIFALAHFRAETFAPLLLLGCVFGGLYLAADNLLPSMLLHSLWNCYVLGTLVLRLHCALGSAAASALMAGGIGATLVLAHLACAALRPVAAQVGGADGSSDAGSGSRELKPA